MEHFTIKNRKILLHLLKTIYNYKWKEYKSYSPFPNSLIYQLLILSDETVRSLIHSFPNKWVYITFKVQYWWKRHNIGSSFYNKNPYDMQQFKQSIHLSCSEASGFSYIRQNKCFPSFFLFCTFLGVYFLIGAAVFFTSDVISDLTNEQEKYITITKIGLNWELKWNFSDNSACDSFLRTYHLGHSFPHTMFATKMLQEYYISRSSLKLQSYWLDFWTVENFISF